MGLFDKVREPVFLKEESSAQRQLDKLIVLKESGDVPKSSKKELERDILLLRAGIFGENNIAFEIRNSHIPMWVIHDLYVEHEGVTAQIDYLIITRKRNFVIECKNLVGNIEINSSGDFIRTFERGKKEGLYSPITQNTRHLELLKRIIMDRRTNFISKALVDKFFYMSWKSVVVLANPKTYLNHKYAKKEVRNQVIRADQLINYIRKVNSEDDAAASSEAECQKYAELWLSLHKDYPDNLTEKYEKLIEGVKLDVQTEQEETEKKSDYENILCPKCGAPMVKRVASRGVNEGKEFYGCSNYPKCRGIVNIG